MKRDVLTLDNAASGSIDLDDAVFGLEPRKDILHRMVVYQLAKRQQGTRKTQERNEVTATGKKFVRQKGSGGARHGDRKAPQFRGGGKAHGPRVRSHAIGLPKKVRALAMRHALSAKRAADELIILEDAKVDAPKTKALKARFDALGLKDALIVDADVDATFGLAARNIPDVDVLPLAGANVYDILRRGKLVLTRGAVAGLEARLGGGAPSGGVRIAMSSSGGGSGGGGTGGDGDSSGAPGGDDDDSPGGPGGGGGGVGDNDVET